MSVFKLKSLISTFIEQSRDRVDKDGTEILEVCPQAIPTAARATEARDRVDSLDSLDSLDSTLHHTPPSPKECNSGNTVQKTDKEDKNYPQLDSSNLKPFLTIQELNELRGDLTVQAHEKAFSSHLIACPYCHMVKGQYCASGEALGRVYDALLLGYDDAQARREDYQLRIDKACIGRRKNH